jgi:phospholipid transport system substrate-binding protein
VLIAFCSGAFAQAADMSTPDGLVKTVTSQVLDQIKADKQIQSGNITRITQLVNEKILPYTDFTRTTRLVMGRNWNTATPQQQKDVVEQFKMLLIRTYSGALAQVRDQQVQYKPFRADPSDTDVVVRSVVLNNGSPIELDYRLYKTPQGWKVYDINVLGAWLIQAYQQQFNEQIQQHGVDGLVQFLTQRNQQLANGKAS